MRLKLRADAYFLCSISIFALETAQIRSVLIVLLLCALCSILSVCVLSRFLLFCCTCSTWRFMSIAYGCTFHWEAPYRFFPQPFSYSIIYSQAERFEAHRIFHTCKFVLQHFECKISCLVASKNNNIHTHGTKARGAKKTELPTNYRNKMGIQPLCAARKQIVRETCDCLFFARNSLSNKIAFVKLVWATHTHTPS